MKTRLIDGQVEGNELLRVVESHDASIDPIAKTARTVRNVSLGTVAKKVPHGLGVKPQGWIAIRIQASAPPGYPFETAQATRTHLTLAMGASAVVDLRVW